MKYLWIVMLVIFELIGWYVAVTDCIATYKGNARRLNDGKEPVYIIYDFTIIWILIHTVLFIAGTFLYSVFLYFGG